MNQLVSIRGQLFEIVTEGDWGGGSQMEAFEDVVQVIHAMPLRKIIELHEKLEEEQRMGALTRTWADEPICDPIVTHLANSPEDGSHLGASLHIIAVSR